MRFRALIAALLIGAPLVGYAQQTPINPANLPSPLPTRGLSDTSAPGGSSVGGGLGITSTGDISNNQTITNWASATDGSQDAIILYPICTSPAQLPIRGSSSTQ